MKNFEFWNVNWNFDTCNYFYDWYLVIHYAKDQMSINAKDAIDNKYYDEGD